MTPSWVPPIVALSLLVIATSQLAIGLVVVLIGLELRKESSKVKEKVVAFTAEAHQIVTRFKGELEGFADLSADARKRLKGAIDTVDGRLRDLDALAEVIQEEAEATALDVASMVRTVRRSGGLLGAARRAMQRRRARD
jgi:hypothetical protein